MMFDRWYRTVIDMTDRPQVAPYGSARDLPSVREMEQQMAVFELFDLSSDQRKQLEELKREHQRITETVDRFYGLLGDRNWVFTGDFNLTAITAVIETEDAGTAENRLIDYYKTDERIAIPLRRLYRFDAMRPRMELLQKALSDYEAGRYYSTILVLLSVMDGFVNDQETSVRQGLHARSSQDMVAWDSVAGHHLGLGHAHQTFTKGFYQTKTTEVTDLFRNGIVHGTLINFDNVTVATKAWNRLFAVADWADARKLQIKPAVPNPSLKESVDQWNRLQEQKALLEQWQPYEYSASSEDSQEITQVCANFLETWQKRQWGLLGQHFMEFGGTRSSVGKRAVEAKDLYGTFQLSVWTILRVRHTASAVAFTDVELQVNGIIYRTDLRWVRIDDAGKTRSEWEPGRWTLSQYGPSHFVKDEAIVKDEGWSNESARPDAPDDVVEGQRQKPGTE